MKQPQWREMVKLVLKHHTQKEVEKITGISQATVSKLANNPDFEYGEPYYGSGSKLIKLYNETLDKEKIHE